tara:strand:+ start:155 stop:613 length:459 start_codon:yes stop_codon:yes gene_type:complete
MARRKNTKFIDPRYFMDEKMERLDEADPHDQPAGGADSLAQKKKNCKGKWMEHGMEGFDGSRGWYGYCDEKAERLDEKDLSAKERRDLPDSDFALPGKGEGPEGKQAGSYPIPDEEHARMALAMVAKHGTSEEKARVRAAVKRKFPNIDQGE